MKQLNLPRFPEGKKCKRGIISAIISGYVGLAFEGSSRFLHSRTHQPLHKAGYMQCHLKRTNKETNLCI